MPILMTMTGLALAAGSFFVAEGMLNPVSTQAATPQVQVQPETVILIAASVEIPFGEPIRREDLMPQTWPAGLAPEGAFNDATMLLGPDGTAPRRATRTIREGELISAENVSDFGATVTMGSALPSGMRAVTINVNTTTAVGGFVSPGDRVDIVLTEVSGDAIRTGTIMSDVSVLAVDQDVSSRGAQDARTVTVQVSRHDSERLVLAQQIGTLSLTLRSHTEISDGATGGVTVADVWGEPEPEIVEEEVVEEVEAPSTIIRVRRGTQTEDLILNLNQ